MFNSATANKFKHIIFLKSRKGNKKDISKFGPNITMVEKKKEV